MYIIACSITEVMEHAPKINNKKIYCVMSFIPHRYKILLTKRGTHIFVAFNSVNSTNMATMLTVDIQVTLSSFNGS